MKLRVTLAASLASFLAITVCELPAQAQNRIAGASYRGNSTTASTVSHSRSSATLRPSATAYSEEFYYDDQSIPAGPQSNGDYADGHYYGDGWVDGCTAGCGDPCGDGGYTSYGGWSFDLLGGICLPGQFYVTADYLYVRSTFSEAIAYLEQDDSVQAMAFDRFHQLEFEYESSFRVGGGYRINCCGEEIRFLFTRMTSNASEAAPPGSFLPYEVSAPPGGQTFIDGRVNVESYDLMYAKTIPLGSPLSCDCGDACGDYCGDACGCDPCACVSCPAWEVTWSGGVRYADVDTRRRFAAVDEEGAPTTTAVALMNFEGAGPRFGLEGRRYFGPGGCFSAYLKGDISLLLGRIALDAERRVEIGEGLQIVTTQDIGHKQIIPVTEIEAGLTGHVTKNSTLTAGYLFGAWHDLGFRDSFTWDSITFMHTGYDDANILGFDGFFARLEVSY